jgi:hypothetical protein
MHLRLSVTSLLVFSAAASSLLAQDKWPENVAGAWLVLRAESYEDGIFDGTDPATHGNLLLLIDNILVYACDKNAANNRRFSETPEIIDSGVQYVAASENENELLAKHIKLGHCSITMTHSAGDKAPRMTLRTVYHNTKFPRRSTNLRVERLNQDAARKRVQAMLERGQIRSSTDISLKLNNWLQQNTADEPTDEREPE